MRKRIYFGHPINTYGTKLEKELLAEIAKALSDYVIENPGKKHHQKNVQRWIKKTGNAMNYFFSVVLPKCQAGIFLPFRDGKWGAGIVGEAKFLHNKGFPIWQITFEGKISEANLAKIQVLSIKETTSRIRDASGKSIPY